jgi:hypothetical protein
MYHFNYFVNIVVTTSCNQHQQAIKKLTRVHRNEFFDSYSDGGEMVGYGNNKGRCSASELCRVQYTHKYWKYLIGTTDLV